MIVNETVLFPKVEYRIETQDEKTEKLINTIEQSKESTSYYDTFTRWSIFR